MALSVSCLLIVVFLSSLSVFRSIILPGAYLLCYPNFDCSVVPNFQLGACQCRIAGFQPEVCADNLFSDKTTPSDDKLTLKNATSLEDALIFLQQSSSCQKMAGEIPITVVTSCPQSAKMADKLKCEQTTELLPPVDYTGSIIDITFRNIHCARCHGVEKDDALGTMAPWSLTFNCADSADDQQNKMADKARDGECQAVFEPRDYIDKYCFYRVEINSVIRNECSRCLDLVNSNNSTDSDWGCLLCQFAFEVTSQFPECQDQESEGDLTRLFKLPRESEKRIKINQKLFKISEFCADDEKFDNLFQKCRKFQCKFDEYAKSGDCLKNSTSYVPSSYQPFPNGSDVLFVDIVKSSYVEFGNNFMTDFNMLNAGIFSQWRLLNMTGNDTIEGSASIVVYLEGTAVDFVDSFLKTMAVLNFVEYQFTFSNYQNVTEHDDCIMGSLQCTTNATVLFVKEDWFARVENGNNTRLYPMENILFKMTVNSATDDIVLEEICVCPHTDVSTASINCSHTLYVYEENEYEVDSNGDLLIVDHHLKFNSKEFYIFDSTAFVCYNPDKTEKFFSMDDIQKYVSWACSVVSVVCLLATVIVYFLFTKLNIPAKLNIGLSVSLIFGQVLLTVTTGADVTVCRYIAAMTHFSWLSAFAWMSAQALQMLITFHPRSLRVSPDEGSFRYFGLGCLGIPMVIVLVCLILDLTPGDHPKVQYGVSSCTWLSSRSGYIYAFFLPIGISLIFNAICFIMTLYYIEQTMTSTEVTIGKKKDKKRLLMYVRLASVMGFTWIFGFIASTTNVSVLWYLYIILNGLQGVFIFLSFCLNTINKELVKAKMSESRFSNIGSAPTETTTPRSKTDGEELKSNVI